MIEREIKNGVMGEGAMDAPSAARRFSSLHDIRFGKSAGRTLAPMAPPLSAAGMFARRERAQRVPASVSWVIANFRAGSGVCARHPLAALVGATHESTLRPRMVACGGALRGARPKRISWSDGGRLATPDTRATMRVQG